MKKTFFLLTLICFSLQAFSAETYRLSPEEAVEIALKNNLDLKTSEIALRTKQRNKRQVYNQLMPSLSTGVTLSRSNLNPGESMRKMFSSESGSSGGTTSMVPSSVYPDWTASFQVNGTFSLNGSFFTAIETVQNDYIAGLITYEDAKATLSKNIKQAYFDLIYLGENVNLIRESLEMAEKRYRQAQRNYNSGLVPDVDLLQAQVSMENVRPQLLQAQNTYDTSLLQFKINLGLNIEDIIELDDSVLDAADALQIELDATNLSNQYLNDRYDIQSIRANIDLLQANKKSTMAAAMSPTFSVSAGYLPRIGIFGSDVADADKNAQYKDWLDSGSFSISLSIPIDTLIPGTRTYTQAAEIQDSIDSMKVTLENAIRLADLEIRSLVMNIDNAREQLEVLQSSVTLAETVYQRYSDGYRLGTVEILDFENVENQLNQARLNLVSGKVTLAKALMDLEYALNRSLSEIRENDIEEIEQ